MYDPKDPPKWIIPWYQRPIAVVWLYFTWPWTVRYMKRAGARHTGWMTWEFGPEDSRG